MKYIVGIDEVGRGSVAGPVTVGMCVLKKQKMAENLLFKIKDSKQLTKNQREIWFLKLQEAEKNKIIFCSTSFISSEIIDTKGIVYALSKATENVLKKINFCTDDDLYVLLDGTLSAPSIYRQKSIIKGDQKEISISAASVYAKVKRDLFMDNLSTEYKNYSLNQNKGYGTKDHIKAIKKYGLSKMHRKTFCSRF